MHTFRVRFKKDIVAEFLPPVRKSNRVIILCGGMPSYPSKTQLQSFLSKKGFWSFVPRYRGSWESDGSFLRHSPHVDILDVIDSLPKGFADLWSGKEYKIIDPEVYVFGSSFGGPAAILASIDKRVRKVLVLSPVVDWRNESREEPLDWLFKFTKLAFGNGYRLSSKDWNKLKSGTFYNPIFYLPKLDPRKIFIMHAKNDKVVYAGPVKKFATKIGCKFILLARGGHMSLSILTKPYFWKKVKKYIKKKHVLTR